MNKPLLQVAMDNLDEKSAFNALEQFGDVVDIIEVGTILLNAEGKQIVRKIKSKYPSKTVLADAKIADAGNILSKMLYEENADIVTIICCADIATIAGVIKIANELNKELQIELTGFWSFEQAKEWKKIGVEQVVYHRSRDSQAAGKNWGSDDIDKIQKLCDMGFKVTITGGVNIDDLKLFNKMPIYIIIAGRAIRETSDPKKSAQEFQDKLKEYWT